MTDNPLFVGLMSGTSADSIDAVVTHITDQDIELRASHTHPLDDATRDRIFQLTRPGKHELSRTGELDVHLGELFADAALAVIDKADLSPSDITAIGSHGQTLRHAPDATQPYTLQIGDPNRIAERTGITTVADFRRRDMAAGGQGAPLVPAFHAAAFAEPGQNMAVINIGGIANVSLISADGEVTGFDTGPGNTLMDYWIGICWGDRFDRDGAWAATGQLDDELYERMINDPYFKRPPPKSTGVDHFNEDWLEQYIYDKRQPEQFVQRTLLELTAGSIADALRDQTLDRIAVCGGGAQNSLLMARLQAHMAPTEIISTEDLGIHPDWVEAAAFAWLARQTLAGLAGNEPRVTGARGARVLGAVYSGG